LAEEHEEPAHLDPAFDVAVAMLAVLSRRFGRTFAEEVRDEIQRHGEALARSDDPDTRADAAGTLQVANSELLQGIIEASPEGDGSGDRA
jgi:hypothetical protein